MIFGFMARGASDGCALLLAAGNLRGISAGKRRRADLLKELAPRAFRFCAGNAAQADSPRFDQLLGELRATPEWAFVEREVEIRVALPHAEQYQHIQSQREEKGPEENAHRKGEHPARDGLLNFVEAAAAHRTRKTYTHPSGPATAEM
jgi:hypothetical protein